MAFCQRSCKRVCQPPLQLRDEGIYSHGCKQGCFQPPGRRSLPGLAFQTRRSCGRAYGTTASWWRNKSGASRPVVEMNSMSQRSFKEVQLPLGLGGHGSAPGGRRTLRSAQWARGFASCALRGEFISLTGRVSRSLNGRAGNHLFLDTPTGPTNWLAPTRSTGSR